MTDEWRVEPDDWDMAIAAAGGPQLIVAGPGTGKTEFLVRRAAHLIETTAVRPSELLLLSFSRRSAGDLRRRIQARLDRSTSSVTAATFHSFAYLVLEAHGAEVFGWSDVPTLLTSPEQVAVVRELLAAERAAGWPVLYRDMLTTRTLAVEVMNFLLRCQEQLIDAAELERRADDRPAWRALPQFMRNYLDVLNRRSRIDYGTLQAKAVEVLGHDSVTEKVASQYRYLLVDEYQDTTVAQAEFLRRLYRPHRNLTVAGDPYQSIYSFRGTELHNIEAFPRLFPDEGGGPAKRLVLTTSFRVPGEILDAAVRVTAQRQLPGAAGPVQPAAGQGSVETYGFDQQSQEAEWIAGEIQRIHLADRTPYARIAVLLRTKRRLLAELSRALDRRRLPHDRPDRRLSDHASVRLLSDCVTAATTTTGIEADRAVERILLGPLFSVPLGQLRALIRMKARQNQSWPSVIRSELPHLAALADLVENRSWATEVPAPSGFWHWWTNLPSIEEVVGDPAQAETTAAWASLSQVLERHHERNPSSTLAGYLELAKDEDFEAQPLLLFHAPEEDRLTLTTLHQAKGLEFDVVFIADATEGVFPDLRPHESLLGSRYLSAAQPSGPAEYAQFRLQEETRLAYMAMGRARKRVVWTATSTGSEHGQQRGASRFLAPVAGVTTVAEATASPQAESRNPVTPLDAEAWLRRMLRDPAQPEARRLAAVAVLSRGESWSLRSADRFAGVRMRGSDLGLVPQGLTLSPSQVQAYTTCPRRYALERRLHVGDETSVYAEFGSLIHKVLEIAETDALDRGDRRSTLEEALEVLDEQWDDGPYGGGPWSEAWRRRAERALHHLYEHWPTSGRAVALERDLTLELAGITWRGRVDRIEEEDGALRIVDYKTSSTSMGLDDAAVSVQLGFYFLAAAADGALAEHGDVTAAEFWYPAQTKRKSLATRSFDPARIDEAAQSMTEGADGILAEDWTPKTGKHCEGCRVRLVCSAWPEGRESYSS